MGSFHPQVLRAALWTVLAARRTDRDLSAGGLDTIRVSPPPRLPDDAGRGVAAVLRRRTDTCLVRALVLQSWHLSQGRPRDLIIGVTVPSEGFRAHAWLDGDPPCHGEGFNEFLRRAAS